MKNLNLLSRLSIKLFSAIFMCVFSLASCDPEASNGLLPGGVDPGDGNKKREIVITEEGSSNITVTDTTTIEAICEDGNKNTFQGGDKLTASSTWSNTTLLFPQESVVKSEVKGIASGGNQHIFADVSTTSFWSRFKSSTYSVETCNRTYDYISGYGSDNLILHTESAIDLNRDTTHNGTIYSLFLCDWDNTLKHNYKEMYNHKFSGKIIIGFPKGTVVIPGDTTIMWRNLNFACSEAPQGVNMSVDKYNKVDEKETLVGNYKYFLAHGKDATSDRNYTSTTVDHNAGSFNIGSAIPELWSQYDANGFSTQRYTISGSIALGTIHTFKHSFYYHLLRSKDGGLNTETKVSIEHLGVQKEVLEPGKRVKYTSVAIATFVYTTSTGNQICIVTDTQSVTVSLQEGNDDKIIDWLWKNATRGCTSGSGDIYKVWSIKGDEFVQTVTVNLPQGSNGNYNQTATEVANWPSSVSVTNSNINGATPGSWNGNVQRWTGSVTFNTNLGVTVTDGFYYSEGRLTYSGTSKVENLPTVTNVTVANATASLASSSNTASGYEVKKVVVNYTLTLTLSNGTTCSISGSASADAKVKASEVSEKGFAEAYGFITFDYSAVHSPGFIYKYKDSKGNYIGMVGFVGSANGTATYVGHWSASEADIAATTTLVKKGGSGTYVPARTVTQNKYTTWVPTLVGQTGTATHQLRETDTTGRGFFKTLVDGAMVTPSYSGNNVNCSIDYTYTSGEKHVNGHSSVSYSNEYQF